MNTKPKVVTQQTAYQAYEAKVIEMLKLQDEMELLSRRLKTLETAESHKHAASLALAELLGLDEAALQGTFEAIRGRHHWDKTHRSAK